MSARYLTGIHPNGSTVWASIDEAGGDNTVRLASLAPHSEHLNRRWATEILSSAKVRDVETAHCPGVAAARALDPKGRFEADEIGGPVDMFRGHFRRVTRREQNRNNLGLWK